MMIGISFFIQLDQNGYTLQCNHDDFSAKEKYAEYDADSNDDHENNGFNDNFLGTYDKEKENETDNEYFSINDNFLADYKHEQLELIEEEPDDYKDFE